MKKEVLKTICKKTFLKNLRRDLQITGIPVMSSGDQFVSESLGRSKLICHALLHELSESSDFFLFLEAHEIDAIINETYLEMECGSALF